MLLWMTLHIESGSNIHVKDQFVKKIVSRQHCNMGKKVLETQNLCSISLNK